MLEPYKEHRDNQLEKLSLWTTLGTLYLALFLVSGDISSLRGGD